MVFDSTSRLKKQKYFHGKLAIYTVFILNNIPGDLNLKNVQKREMWQNIEFDRNKNAFQ